MNALPLDDLSASELNAAIDDTNFPSKNIENGGSPSNGKKENNNKKLNGNHVLTPLKLSAKDDGVIEEALLRAPRTSTTPG